MAHPLALAVVEDHPHLRARLEQQLAFFDQVDLMLVAESGDEFVADLEVRQRSGGEMPAVVLMDIEMPGSDGIETTSVVKSMWPSIDVLMLTVFEDEARIFAAIQAGASGYLLKDCSTDAIVKAVQEVAEGGAPTSPLVARKLLEHVRHVKAEEQSAREATAAFSLTPREKEVLERLVEDETEAEIGDKLGISAHTIRSHVKNIYAKMQVHSRAQAVRVALEQRLI